MNEDQRPFLKNMLKGTFKTKVSNTDEMTSPVVEAIRENTEAVKDKDVAKQMSKPIVTALVDVMEKIDERTEHDDSKIDRLFNHIQSMKVEKILDKIETLKGDPGPKPTEEELIGLIKPLIPEPVPGDKGDPGKDYIITEKDKKEIAKSIKVPIVEKVIEHTIETVIEKPIITNEIKEVAVADTAEVLKEKLESLKGDDRLDAKSIKNLPKGEFGGGMNRLDGAIDTRISNQTDGQTLVWDEATQFWVNSDPVAGSGTPGGSDTQVQFNDGGSFGGDAGLTYNKTTNKLTLDGDLEVTSADASDGTNRITATSYERAVYPTHYGELLRLDWAKADAKPSIAFRDNSTSPGTPATKGWLLAHDYLLYTDAAYTKTFVDANVNTSTDRITITSHGFSNSDAVKLWTTGGSLPTGIAHLKQYYAKAVDANTIELYRDSGLTLLINITAATGGGTHNIANVTLGNNPHRHMSMEVSDSTGAVQTRFEIPYDLDSTYIKVVDADFIITGGKKLQMTGENGVNKDLTFGLDETSVYTRWALRQDNTTESGSNVGSDFKVVRYSDAGVSLDSALTITRSTGLVTAAGNIESNGTTLDLDSATTASVISDRGATTNFASFILRTAGTDQWGMRLTNDSTNNLYIRDLVNGVNILQAAQGATPTVTPGGAWDFGGSSSLEIPNGAGGTTVNAAGEICVDTTSDTLNFFDGSVEQVLTPIMSKSISIESPTATEDLSMFYTDEAITITKIVFAITGATSVTTTIRHSTDRSATGNEVVTGGTTANSTTTGNVVTSFNDATVPADSFVWLETTALSGTPTSLNVTIFYRQDA